MKLFRCKICGDPYVGESRPTNCPFCGAHERYIVEQEDYEEPKIEELSEVSKKNLEAALKVETSNAEFYYSASKKAETDEIKNLFKALAKVEAEHASLLCKALDIQKPPINQDSDVASENDLDNLKESHRREENAIRRYGAFLSEATESRVEEIFAALVSIESDHLELSEKRI